MFFSKARRSRDTGGVQTNDNGGLFVTFEDVIDGELARIDETYNVNGKGNGNTANGSGGADAAGEYYELTRERAAELYDQAASAATEVYSQRSEKVGEGAQTARDTAARRPSTIAEAIDAGKKAYQEEKRRTELTGRIEAAPQYTEKSN